MLGTFRSATIFSSYSLCSLYTILYRILWIPNNRTGVVVTVVVVVVVVDSIFNRWCNLVCEAFRLNRLRATL